MPLRKEETKTPTATLQKSPKPHLKQPALANAVLAFPLPLPYNTSHLLCHSSLHRYSNTASAPRRWPCSLCHSSLHRYSNTGAHYMSRDTELCHSSLHRYSNTSFTSIGRICQLCHSSLHRYSNTTWTTNGRSVTLCHSSLHRYSNTPPEKGEAQHALCQAKRNALYICAAGAPPRGGNKRTKFV